MITAEQDSALQALAESAVPFAQQHRPPKFKRRQVLSLAYRALNEFHEQTVFDLVLFARQPREWEIGALHPDLKHAGTVTLDPVELRCPEEHLPVCLWDSPVLYADGGGELRYEDGWLWAQGTFRQKEWTQIARQLEPLFAAAGLQAMLPSPLGAAQAVISFEAIAQARLDITAHNMPLAEAQRRFAVQVGDVLRGLPSGAVRGTPPQTVRKDLGADPADVFTSSGSWKWPGGELPLRGWSAELLLLG